MEEMFRQHNFPYFLHPTSKLHPFFKIFPGNPCISDFQLIYLCHPFTFCVGIYTEEARDRLKDPLATWKIQGANSCRLIILSIGNINSLTNEFTKKEKTPYQLFNTIS